jgi:hypothetical protein
MKLDPENLYSALWQIGAGCEGEPLPRRDLLNRLAELKIIDFQPNGKPTLTKYGERCYSGIESGDRGVPEFG